MARKVQTTIRLTVVTVFLIGTIVTAAAAIGLQYYFGQSMARNAAADLYTTASTSIASELRSIGRINANVIDLLAENPALPDPTLEAAHLKIITQVLQKNPLYYGVYLGRSDDSFFEVINLNTSEKARRRLHALPSDRWLVITMRDGPRGRERVFQYLDEALQLRVERGEASDFQASTRPWYTSAASSGEIEVSAPYLFAQLGVPGRTVSKAISGSDTVVGIDMTLASISEYLGGHDLAEEADLYLYNNEGEVIASSLEYQYAQPQLPIPALALSEEEREYLAALPPLRVSNELDWPPFDYTQTGAPRGYSIDVIHMIAAMLGLEVSFVNGLSWNELVGQFRAGEIDILHSVILTDANRDWGLAGKPYVSLPYALVTQEGSAALTDLSVLGDGALAIPAGWSIIPIIRQRFPDITIVETSSTLKALEMVLSGEAFAALDNEVILRYIAQHYFLQGLQYHGNIGLGAGPVPDKLHLMVDGDRPQLRALLDRAIEALGADQRRYLSRAWLEFDEATATATSATVPTNVLVEMAQDPARHEQLAEVAIEGRDYLLYSSPTGALDASSMYVGIVSPVAEVIAPFLDKVKLSILVTAGFLLLLMPLSWFFANPIVRPVRQLALENDKVRLRHYDDVQRVESHVKELDELSESMVNMVDSIRAHELAQRELMDAFIRLIAQAIDDKSPYTGGHCERVPELALMLAAKASASEHPAFKEFELNSDDQWREYRIAAWLHDCGKITTPEHIVDKGSKLETIYNRLHEVRMRFEVLWRDAEVSYWEQRFQEPSRETEFRSQMDARKQQLQDDYSFVAECNVGGEFLDQDKQDRLRSIATESWIRQFDDRIGLSPVEELRLKGEPVPTPAREPLLADRPEHIIERTRSTDYAPELGINMDIPEHLYNQGEIYNLSISRGTLTSEDRFKINEHMISTIKMLESLPFPEELKKVPRYASTHHETMRGNGYPRKLPGAELSIPERILAVADVFEALTASDRPYKKAKPVSVAVDILHKMVEDNHIDRDCFELFIREEVYLDYARRYLDEGQVDTVDADAYLQATG